jgi:hypothetical protein
VTGLVWAPPPVRARQQRREVPIDHDLIAAELRSNPGEWALIPAASTGLAGHIRRGDVRAYRPPRTFEAVRRDVDGEICIYARYVGQESP